MAGSAPRAIGGGEDEDMAAAHGEPHRGRGRVEDGERRIVDRCVGRQHAERVGRIEEVLPDLARFAEDTVLVGHDIGFDLRIGNFFQEIETNVGTTLRAASTSSFFSISLSDVTKLSATIVTTTATSAPA